MPSYIMVCEGRSEFVYLQRLQSFLDSQASGWNVPLNFIPKIPANPDGDESGGGFYTNVTRCYRRQRNRDKKLQRGLGDDILRTQAQPADARIARVV